MCCLPKKTKPSLLGHLLGGIPNEWAAENTHSVPLLGWHLGLQGTGPPLPEKQYEV